MITEAYTLLEVLAAALIGAVVAGVAVYLATAADRHDAALDRQEAAEDLAAARATQIRLEAARESMWLHPAYSADTSLLPPVTDQPEHTAMCPDLYYCPTAGEVESGCHGGFDICCSAPHLHQPAPDAPVEETVPVSDLDDMRMPDFVPGQPLPEHQDDLDDYEYGSFDEVRPPFTGRHQLSSFWGGLPGECGASCACDVTYDGFDTIAEASGYLDGHIEKANAALDAAAELVPPAVDGPAEACCTGHGDEPCAPDSGYALPYCCDACPDRVPSTDLEPVTADDLAPIGPDRMPTVPRWAWPIAALALLFGLGVLLLVALVALGWSLTDLWTARRRRRAAEVQVIELEHPAPAEVYAGRHRAPAGRWGWVR